MPGGANVRNPNVDPARPVEPTPIRPAVAAGPFEIASPAAEVDFRALRSRIAGSVSLPRDDDWDEARRAWNLAVDQRPTAVVHAETAADVVAVVDFARVHGYQVAPQGTGHAASPLGPLDDTILLKTSRMRGLEIDAERQVARVEAGVLWLEVSQAAAKHGLIGLAGSSPDVGVVGYALGGGVSFLGRKLGLAANSIVAAELVTADGRHLRIDRETEPDLFWAIRGGGGNFGVVTALEIRLFPVTELYAGSLFFPIERAAEILGAWREWVDGQPEEMTSVGRFMQFPPIPDIPEALRGNSFVLVEAIYAGDEADGARLVQPLRDLGPEIDTIATIPTPALTSVHMDPEHPVPGTGDGMLLDDFPLEAIDALTAVVPGSPLLSVEIRHLGGALRRRAAGHGAVAQLDAAFAMVAVGIAMTPELEQAVDAHVDLVKAALGPWNAVTTNANFSERPTDPRRIWPEHVYFRLRRIKAQVDPAGMIRSNHPIPAAV
jgi:FAD binding domain